MRTCNRMMLKVVVAAVATALPTTALAAPSVPPAGGQRASVPAARSEPDVKRFGMPPSAVKVRVSSWGSRPHVEAVTRLNMFRTKDLDKGRLADRVTLQLLVRARRPDAAKWSGAAKYVEIAGPRITVKGRGREGWMRDSHPLADARVKESSGVLRADLTLSKKHARAIRRVARKAGRQEAADRIFVRVTHLKDMHKSVGKHQLLQVAGDRAQRRSKPFASAAALDDSGYGNTATFSITNSMQNDVVLLASPASCMYDTRYGENTLAHPSNANLGSINGAWLGPNQSIQVTTRSDSQNLDGPDNDDYHSALSDYTDSIASATSSPVFRSEVPDWAAPPGNGKLDPATEWHSEVRSFVTSAMWNLFSTTNAYATLLDKLDGLWNQVKVFFGGEVSTAAVTYGVLDVASTLATPILGLTEGFTALFKGGCNDNPSYFVMGATDIQQPWINYAMPYNFDAGTPGPTRGSQNTYLQPTANGMIVNRFLYSKWQANHGVDMASVQPWAPPWPDDGSHSNFWEIQEADNAGAPLARLAVTQKDGGGYQAVCHALGVNEQPEIPKLFGDTGSLADLYGDRPGIVNDPYTTIYQNGRNTGTNYTGQDPFGNSREYVFVGNGLYAYDQPNLVGINWQYLYENNPQLPQMFNTTVSFSDDGLTWTDYWTHDGAPVDVPSGVKYAQCNGQRGQVFTGSIRAPLSWGGGDSLDWAYLVSGTRVPSNVWAVGKDGTWSGK